MKSKRLSVAWVLCLIMLALILTLARNVWAASKERVLYNFNGASDGEFPIWYGSLVFDKKGQLYGTTSWGGPKGYGTVFQLSHSKSAWKQTVLYSFAGNGDGAQPDPGVIFDAAGNLYGTTVQGGSQHGTVFELSPDSGGGWTKTIIHTFTGADGDEPVSGLAVDKAGNLYGTTTLGGTYGFGTVFEMSNSGGTWTESVLHSFNNDGTDGQEPFDALIMDKAGSLYGTTLYGGTYNAGAVFELKSSNGTWTENVLYSFKYSQGDGAYPQGGVVFDKMGNLYGTTVYAAASGCNNGCGTVYELKHSRATWTESVLYTFRGGKDGDFPNAGLTFDATGNLYGTTSFGGGGSCSLNGFLGCGTVYKVSHQKGAWKESVLHWFDSKHGSDPQAAVILDKRGNLYGTAFYGGSGACNSGNLPGCGLVFEITP